MAVWAAIPAGLASLAVKTEVAVRCLRLPKAKQPAFLAKKAATESQETGGSFPPQEQRDNGSFSPPGGEFAPPDGQAASASQQSVLILLGVSVIVLLIGLVVAIKYRR